MHYGDGTLAGAGAGGHRSQHLRRQLTGGRLIDPPRYGQGRATASGCKGSQRLLEINIIHLADVAGTLQDPPLAYSPTVT